jgi:hypothetical protein
MACEMKYILLDLQARDEGIAIIKINRPEAMTKYFVLQYSSSIIIVITQKERKNTSSQLPLLT